MSTASPREVSVLKVAIVPASEPRRSANALQLWPALSKRTLGDSLDRPHVPREMCSREAAAGILSTPSTVHTWPSKSSSGIVRAGEQRTRFAC